ncbi:MAG: hypothetical protein WCV84_04890 [Patescibacteria group bacterium]
MIPDVLRVTNEAILEYLALVENVDYPPDYIMSSAGLAKYAALLLQKFAESVPISYELYTQCAESDVEDRGPRLALARDRRAFARARADQAALANYRYHVQDGVVFVLQEHTVYHVVSVGESGHALLEQILPRMGQTLLPPPRRLEICTVRWTQSSPYEIEEGLLPEDVERWMSRLRPSPLRPVLCVVDPRLRSFAVLLHKWFEAGACQVRYLPRHFTSQRMAEGGSEELVRAASSAFLDAERTSKHTIVICSQFTTYAVLALLSPGQPVSNLRRRAPCTGTVYALDWDDLDPMQSLTEFCVAHHY